jgi:hypothetical protein
MKLIIYLLLILQLNLNTSKTVVDYDSELSYIAEKFSEEIMNEDECETQRNEIVDLIEEIQKAIESEGEYSSDEKITLRKLKNEAEAIENFIGTIGACSGVYSITMNDLTLSSKKINYKMSIVNSQLCLKVITIELNNYTAYLFKNDYQTNYLLSYNWKSKNGLSKGNGEFAISKGKIREFYNNRDNPKQKTIIVTNLNCVAKSY